MMGFISNQTITITLVGKSAFELVHLCKGCWYPLTKWLNFATFLERFAVNRVTSLRLVVQKTFIHCSKTFTHTNIIKAKKF